MQISKTWAALALYTACLTACTKNQESVAPPAGDEVVVNNGVVKFKNFAVYENYISGTQNTQQNSVLQYVKNYPGYISLSTNLQQNGTGNGNTTARWNQYTGVDSIDAKIADLLEDTAFVSIINADGIVQIGDYYVQYNPFTDKVLVMHQSHHATTYQALINKDENNRNIFVFTAADDVLAYFEENNFPITPPRGSNVVEWPLASGRMRVPNGPFYLGGFPACSRLNPLFNPILYNRTEECGPTPPSLIYALGYIYNNYGVRFLLRTRIVSMRSHIFTLPRQNADVYWNNGQYSLKYYVRGRGETDLGDLSISVRNGSIRTDHIYSGGRSLMRLRFEVRANTSSASYPIANGPNQLMFQYPAGLASFNY
ncbi:MAG: hypothetical protein EAY72_09140 [Bacteroidetes bacterium]|nr:MAG: hypothetical protein EAY72_09140 [Bacteroidota bacterium]